MMPLVSSAKVAISDSDLDAVTARTGVTVTFNNVNVYTSLSALSWGDSDGFTGYASPGFAGLANIAVVWKDTTTAFPLVIASGNMILDVGTNATTGSLLKIYLPQIAIGGDYANISATFKTDTARALNTSTHETKISVIDLSLHVNGYITVGTHGAP